MISLARGGLIHVSCGAAMYICTSLDYDEVSRCAVLNGPRFLEIIMTQDSKGEFIPDRKKRHMSKKLIPMAAVGFIDVFLPEDMTAEMKLAYQDLGGICLTSPGITC